MSDLICSECVAICEHIGVYEQDGALVNRYQCPVCSAVYNILIEDDFEEMLPPFDHPDSPIII